MRADAVALRDKLDAVSTNVDQSVQTAEDMTADWSVVRLKQDEYFLAAATLGGNSGKNERWLHPVPKTPSYTQSH